MSTRSVLGTGTGIGAVAGAARALTRSGMVRASDASWNTRRRRAGDGPGRWAP